MKPKNKTHDILTTIAAYAILIIIVAAAIVAIHIMDTSPVPDNVGPNHGLFGYRGY
jgi:hypothetical protein